MVRVWHKNSDSASVVAVMKDFQTDRLSDPMRTVWFMSNHDSMTIDCDTCVMQETSACDDCIVTYLCERPVEQAVVISMADFKAMRALAEVGLVPDLKHATIAKHEVL